MTDDPRLSDDIDAEISDHLQQRVAELRRGGLSDAEARARAAREFGDVSEAKRALMRIDARIARRRRPRVFAGLWQDVRHAIRRARHQPAASILIVSTLALGLGFATAVFTVVDQRILRDPPFLHGDRLVIAIHLSGPNGGGGNSLFPQKLVGWQHQPAVFQRFEAYAPVPLELQTDGAPEQVRTLVVSVGLFDMLGVRPRLGRGFTQGDGLPGGENVVVLGHGFWTTRFGGDPSALGSRIVLNNVPYTIVGVMPPHVGLMNEEQPVWIPLDLDAWGANNPNLGFFGLGRLREGLAAAAAQTMADDIAAELQKDTPLERGWYLGVHQMAVADVRPAARTALFVLLAAVAALLVIACVNVTNLLAGQALSRQGEMELQSALGASRWRLIRHVLLEGLLLATVAGAAALLLARVVLDVMMAIAPEEFSFRATVPIAIDLRVLAAGGIAALTAGLFVAIWPALRATATRRSSGLRVSARGSRPGPSFRGATGALVVIEVALAMVLLTGSALLARTLINLYAVDPRFDVERLVEFDVPLRVDRYPTELSRRAFFDELDEVLRKQPGIEGSAYAWSLPPESGGFSIGIAQSDAGIGGEDLKLPFNRVSPSYFETLGIPIVDGRRFEPSDTLDQIIVSEALAKKYWPGESPVGRRFRRDVGDQWATVVGVAGDVSISIGNLRTDLMMYEPFDATPSVILAGEAGEPSPPRGPVQRRYALRSLIVRATEPATVVPFVRERILELDARQSIEKVVLASDAYVKPFGEQRFLMRVMSGFAFCALVMAAAGIIGVLLQAVTYRRREIGIRVALGATPSSIVRLIVSRAGLLAVCGAALGVAGSIAGARYLESLLFGVSPYDLATLVVVALVLAATAAVACWWPTRRALAVEPVEVLRAE